MQSRDRLRHSFGEYRCEPGVSHGGEHGLYGIDLKHDAGLCPTRRKAAFQQAAGRELSGKQSQWFTVERGDVDRFPVDERVLRADDQHQWLVEQLLRLDLSVAGGE